MGGGGRGKGGWGLYESVSSRSPFHDLYLVDTKTANIPKLQIFSRHNPGLCARVHPFATIPKRALPGQGRGMFKIPATTSRSSDSSSRASPSASRHKPPPSPLGRLHSAYEVRLNSGRKTGSPAYSPAWLVETRVVPYLCVGRLRGVPGHAHRLYLLCHSYHLSFPPACFLYGLCLPVPAQKQNETNPYLPAVVVPARFAVPAQVVRVTGRVAQFLVAERITGLFWKPEPGAVQSVTGGEPAEKGRLVRVRPSGSGWREWWRSGR